MTTRTRHGNETALALFGLLVLAVLLAVALWVLIAFPFEDSLLATVVIGGFGWLIKSSYEEHKERQRRNAERKLAEYQKFLQFMNEVTGKGADSKSDDDLAEFRLWSMGLALFASDEVIRTWNDFRRNAISREPIETVHITGRLLLAMRKDCGATNTRLTNGDLLRLFVHDVDSIA